ncbi:hypothetical protein lerEdw1_013899 [Lerista edwardsae]|nr:hypothetical protein lerEdw1_013899 [Lerista edwardsae]
MHYYRYSSAEVSCCYKYLLFSYNIAFWVSTKFSERLLISTRNVLHLAGVAFLGVGLWAWSEKGVLSDLSKMTRFHGFDPVFLVLFVGGVMFILGFAGCVGALRENICLLKFFCGTIVLIFILEMAAAVLAFLFQDWVRDRVETFFKNNIRSYRDDIDLQNLIDSLQKMQKVVNTQCGYDVRNMTKSRWDERIYTRGCIPALEAWLPRNIYIVAGVFVAIALLQIFGIFLARTLISDIEAVKAGYHF